MLLLQGADPDSFDTDGMGALHVACSRNRLTLLHLLLSSGADVELISRDARGSRPLHTAIQHEKHGVGVVGVGALLAFGADPLAERGDRKSADTLAANTKFARLVTPASDAWASAGVAHVHRAALPHAVASGRAARVRALVAQRTHPDSADENGNAGAHLACACGDDGLLSLLLSAGASANLAAQNVYGARPLHFAAIVGDVQCTRRLLQAGADASLPDLTRRLPRERCGVFGERVRALLVKSLDADFTSLPTIPVRVSKMGPVRAFLLKPPLNCCNHFCNRTKGLTDTAPGTATAGLRTQTLPSCHTSATLTPLSWALSASPFRTHVGHHY